MLLSRVPRCTSGAFVLLPSGWSRLPCVPHWHLPPQLITYCLRGTGFMVRFHSRNGAAGDPSRAPLCCEWPLPPLVILSLGFTWTFNTSLSDFHGAKVQQFTFFMTDKSHVLMFTIFTSFPRLNHIISHDFTKFQAICEIILSKSDTTEISPATDKIGSPVVGLPPSRIRLPSRDTSWRKRAPVTWGDMRGEMSFDLGRTRFVDSKWFSIRH